MKERTIIKGRGTRDRGPPDGSIAIHTVEQLGPNMARLPSGALLCRNVPMARVGWMMYGPNETPIEPGPNGVAYVERDHSTLFADTCIQSFVGAAVVDEHPPDDVVPSNWKRYSKGSILAARAGTGDDIDVVLGDVLINDEDLIKSVLTGKREVSAGYDADYEQVSSGVGKQTNIIVNHLALVEKGRCGPRCSIGDSESINQPEKEQPMATLRKKITTGTRRVALDGLRQKVKDAEAELLEAENEVEDQPTGDTHIHIHTGGPAGMETTADEGELPDDANPAAPEGAPAASGAPTNDDPTESRFAAIEGTLKELAAAVAKLTAGESEEPWHDELMDEPKGENEDPDPTTEDEFPEDVKEKAAAATEKAKTGDSKALATGYAQVLARAEVLVPGFNMPTFDSAKPRAKTIDLMCAARRKCLLAVGTTRDGATLLSGITGAPTLNLSKMGCKDVATLFNAASGAKAVMNNAAATRDGVKTLETETTPSGPVTLASINETNRAFWAARAPK